MRQLLIFIACVIAWIIILLFITGCARGLYLVTQDGPANCGQTCVAMIAHVEIDEAERAIGHDHATEGHELISGLGKLGIKCSTNAKAFRYSLPNTAIVKVRLRDGRLHWVVYRLGHFYDPRYPVFPSKDLRAWIISYIEIEGDL
jgi:hypothetical protein